MNEQSNSDISKQDALQNARKQITRSLLLATAALGVIVFACYAWFVNNSHVTGILGGISMDGSSFELASIGSDSVFTENTPESYRVEAGATWNNDGKYTAGKSAIVWQLNEGSHMNNIASIDSENQGIRPGSYGTLQFYVIPKTTGNLKLNLDLELIPILHSTSSISEDATQKQNLEQLLHGHLLFSYECTRDSNYDYTNTPTLIGLQNTTFSLSFESVNEDEDEAILVTMRWIWPYVLSDVKNDKLEGVCSGSSIISLMEDLPSYFFYNEGNPVSPPDLENDFQDYNDYFNAADQFLGEHLQYLIVRLNAEEA